MMLSELLQAETQRLGFLLWGVAAVAPPPHWNTYQEWIAAERHAGMAYLSAERAMQRRAQPGLILPEARALLVVGMRYFAPAFVSDSLPTGEALGRVAAYAWGDDYHEIIPPYLDELNALIEKQVGRAVLARSYTDSGPLLERDHAQRAGLGWIGKNTCLVSPQNGSFFLLGESLLAVEIEPSLPFQSDHCGSCRRCIEACPTSCIGMDRTIDAGRCISYLTIESKGAIPPDLRPRLGDWVFGCDVCQSVCPWNLRFAELTGHPALRPSPGVPRPLLRRELHLTPQEFNRKFKRSPIRRAKRRGYLRNLAVALGNQRDTAAIPDLESLLSDEPEPLARAHAAWALGRMRATRARRAIEKAARGDPDVTVRIEAQAALDETNPL